MALAHSESSGALGRGLSCTVPNDSIINSACHPRPGGTLPKAQLPRPAPPPATGLGSGPTTGLCHSPAGWEERGLQTGLSSVSRLSASRKIWEISAFQKPPWPQCRAGYRGPLPSLSASLGQSVRAPSQPGHWAGQASAAERQRSALTDLSKSQVRRNFQPPHGPRAVPLRDPPPWKCPEAASAARAPKDDHTIPTSASSRPLVLEGAPEP